MIKETISVRTKMTKLSITNNEITAILRSDDTKTGLRLYSDGHIGIAGTIGKYDEDKLTSDARKMLEYKVPYDCAPTENTIKTVDLSNKFDISDEEFLKTSEKLLSTLKANYPDFSYNEKIRLTEEEIILKNDAGTDLRYRDKYVTLELITKHKTSKSMIDGFAINLTRMYDFNDAYKTASELCDYYEEKADIEQECKMPVVIMDPNEVRLGKFHTDLHGRSYGTNTSLFSGKTGQKLFDENFTLYVDRNSLDTYSCFFDGEGTMLENGKFPLIENGVLRAPFSGKKIACKYNLPITSSASLIYDSVPNTAASGISVEPSGKTIKQLLGGRKAIYVVFASGGDFTSQGEYASPVQAAYLFDGEKIYGRLPQLAISSNVFDMFGKDFIGLSTDGGSENSPFKYLAINMNVRKIGGYM